MTAKTIRMTAASGTLALATLAFPQDIQIAQIHKEISEFNGMQFTYQISNSNAGMQGKVITGAPYQAEEKSVMTQTLSDGNRIVQATTSRVYRDQQGRTRVERSLKGLAPEDGVEKTVVINDPVAAAHFVLDESNRTVMKSSPTSLRDAKTMAETQHSLELALGKAAGSPHSVGAPIIVTKHRLKDGSEDSKTESLGKQVMEGLSVEGTRTTVTIPAGAMFNERPIEIVSEKWFSPDLQMVIMSKRTDPRMGETVYTVSNINRANPEPSLFQVPAGYSESQPMQRTLIHTAPHLD